MKKYFCTRQIEIVLYKKTQTKVDQKMDVLPSGNIFHELQVVHDTGYYDGKVSPEEHWQQVGLVLNLLQDLT